MITITKRLEIDAGHRLLNHEGKCKNAHGHRYAFEFTLAAPELDKLGRVIDFSVVKQRLGGWLDENWDHGFIVQLNDPLLVTLRKEGLKLFTLEVPPTAENLAAYMANVAKVELPDLELLKVRCWETPTCHADWTP